MNIDQATALVTGANRGIGRALVVELLNRGARKVYAGVRQERAFSALRALDPQRVHPLLLDITEEDQIDSALTSKIPHRRPGS